MRRTTAAMSLLVLGILGAVPTVAMARIKLITLPVRQRVEIQLDNPGATLVEEERIVPLVKGLNQVDFSWANTQIDPNTIVFRMIPRAGAPEGGAPQPDAPPGKPLDVKVLSVSYPPNEAALVWQVASSDSGSARVRISYLLGNLTKSFNYRAVASHDEKTLTLREYMRLQNLANEEFGSTGLWAGFGPSFLKPIGLNETKEMLVEKFESVPIKKTYTCDPQEFGYLDEPQKKLLVPMHYVLKNDKANNLGTAPLQFGKVRIFQDDGRGSTAFLGEDWGKFTPLDDEMPLSIGIAQDVVVKRTIDKNEQKRVAGNLFNRDVIVKYEIENFKDKAVPLDLQESLRFIRNEVQGDTGRDVQWELGDQTTLEGGPDKEKSNFDRVVFHADLPARGADDKAAKIVHKLHVIIKNEW
ncbi:MAG: hypothetical protein A2V98_21515 [Planctomycetes bacterium RBG_16_64_12]|nr:MAG: hypothetical protein A2V98_21515 [Planctomycetes bacterium RBG_16_64_12]